MSRPSDCPKANGRKVPCTLAHCRYYERHATRSCALWQAEQGPHLLAEIADVIGCTRERVRQIEARALRKLLDVAARRGLELHAIEQIGVWDLVDLENSKTRLDSSQTEERREAYRLARRDDQRRRSQAYADRMRSARVAAGVSRRDMALLVGCSLHHLTNVESGWHKPDDKILAAYERLGVVVSDVTLRMCAR